MEDFQKSRSFRFSFHVGDTRVKQLTFLSRLSNSTNIPPLPVKEMSTLPVRYQLAPDKRVHPPRCREYHLDNIKQVRTKHPCSPVKRLHERAKNKEAMKSCVVSSPIFSKWAECRASRPTAQIFGAVFRRNGNKHGRPAGQSTCADRTKRTSPHYTMACKPSTHMTRMNKNPCVLIDSRGPDQGKDQRYG